MTDQPTTDLRDRIAEALEQADYRLDMRRGDLADAVMPVLHSLTLRELELLARPNTTPSRPEPRPGAAAGLVPRAVRPLDVEHDELMARAEAEHQARTGAEQARKTADRAAVLREAAQHLYTALFPAVYNDLGQKAAEGVNRAVSELRRVAAEAQQQESGSGCAHCVCCHAWGDREAHAALVRDDAAEAQQPASTAPLAAGFPLVKGRCPACRHASLFLGTGGYPTCSNHECPEPDAATTVLEQYAREAHAPSHTWKVESPRREQWASWGATYDDREWAHERYESAIENASARPFRLVRATTTYTVEAEHQPAAPVGSAAADTSEETDRG